MIHEEYNTHLHFHEQQYIVLVLQMQNWDARGLKGKKKIPLLLHIFQIITFHTYKIVTGPWKLSFLVPSGRRLSILTAFDPSSPSLAKTSHRLVKLPRQQRGEAECQEHEGPTSTGLRCTWEVLAHSRFGCWGDWEGILRRYPHLVFPKQAVPPFLGKTDQAMVSLHSITWTSRASLSARRYPLPTEQIPVLPLLVTTSERIAPASFLFENLNESSNFSPNY